MTRRRQFLSLAGWLALSFATASVGAVASLDAPTFYAQLDKPVWAPPPGIFGPVWSTLYFLMGVAAWLVWKRRHTNPQARVALTLFVIQLVLNALWSWLFFRWRLGGASLVDVVALWAVVAATLVAFWRISRPAGALLAPYLAWVSFASALTASVWQRNPTLL